MNKYTYVEQIDTFIDGNIYDNCVIRIDVSDKSNEFKTRVVNELRGRCDERRYRVLTRETYNRRELK